MACTVFCEFCTLRLIYKQTPGVLQCKSFIIFANNFAKIHLKINKFNAIINWVNMSSIEMNLTKHILRFYILTMRKMFLAIILECHRENAHYCQTAVKLSVLFMKSVFFSQGGTSFVDLLCFSVFRFLCLCVCLFICVLWSPDGKELTSWLSFAVSYCEFVIFPLVSWPRFGT